MIRSRAIDILLRSGARLGRTTTGTLVSNRVPPELAPLAAQLADDIALGVAGTRRIREPGKPSIGHAWRRCPDCGREALTAKEKACYLTPKCKGRLYTWHDPQPLTLAGQPVPCARPGCERPATTLTAWHEPLCPSDFTHLALALEHQENR
jgi:hypothetical protein